MTGWMSRAATLLVLAVSALVASGCVSPGGETWDEQYASAMTMHDEVLSEAKQTWPELESAMTGSAGYIVSDLAAIKVLLIGTANGYSVVVDNATGTKTVMKNFVWAFGPGVELSRSQSVIILPDAESVAMARTEAWDTVWAAAIGLEFGGGVLGDAEASSRGAYRDIRGGVALHGTFALFSAKPMEPMPAVTE